MISKFGNVKIFLYCDTCTCLFNIYIHTPIDICHGFVYNRQIRRNASKSLWIKQENLGHLNECNNIIHFLDICIPSIIPKKGFLGISQILSASQRILLLIKETIPINSSFLRNDRVANYLSNFHSNIGEILWNYGLKGTFSFCWTTFMRGQMGSLIKILGSLIVNDWVSIIINSNKIVEIFSSFWYQRHQERYID